MTGRRLPYPGLRAFRREEAEIFFGRETLIDEMVERLAKGRFLSVLGASGTGKSSLVHTGLLDALELGLHARAGGQRSCTLGPNRGETLRKLCCNKQACPRT